MVSAFCLTEIEKAEERRRSSASLVTAGYIITFSGPDVKS